MPTDQVAAVIEEPNVDDSVDVPSVDDGQVQPGRGFFLMGLMVGSAIGAALALLYTPRSVEKVRHELADPSGELDVPADDDALTAIDSADAPL